MNNAVDIQQAINETLEQLKDFQKKTVENIYTRFYIENEDRHLVADEVGLGKTIVARGLIAKILQNRIKECQKKPVRIIYICSNQALANQNLDKLNIFRDKGLAVSDVGRIIFQAIHKEETSCLHITSLTPSTSFRLIRGSGIARERLLIFSILAYYNVFRKGKRNNGLKLFLKGYVTDLDWWLPRCDSYRKESEKSIRKPIFNDFKAKIKQTTLSYAFYKQVYDELGLKREHNLQEIIIKYAEKLNPGNSGKFSGPNQLISLLRSILTDICLEYLKADLYILDEFQRFKDLIETENKPFDQLSEAARIAKKVFEKHGAKVLMLSATPFKPYTTRTDEDFDENHYKEFETVLWFLLRDYGLISEFQKDRKKFFELLRRPEEIDFQDHDKLNDQLFPKRHLETLYRKVISRTERLIVSDDKNTLVKYLPIPQYAESPFRLTRQDIEDYQHTDSLVKVLEDNNRISKRSIIDFVISSPHPFSYLDGYKIKKVLEAAKKNRQIKTAIERSSKGWIDWNKIQQYRPLSDIPNAKIRYMLSEIRASGLWKRLWISPSIPYYPLHGAFAGSENDSKFLIFSKWVMVPKMIASLISYETERLTIGDDRTLGDDESGRKYTPPMGEKKRQPRKPSKILALHVKEGKPGSMTAFTLLYPSLTLAKIYHPLDNSKQEKQLSLGEIRSLVSKRISSLILEAGLKKYCSSSRKTRNWYWAAPLLLDKYFEREAVWAALNVIKYFTSDFIRNQRKTTDADDNREFESQAALKHLDELKKVFQDPSLFEFGEMPDDLVDKLTDMALGSPAILAYRTLGQYFPEEGIKLRFLKALDIASEFHSLFDKPESIATVQLAAILKRRRRKAQSSVYWSDVLDYCVDGCLQSVMDEYGHMVYSDNRNLESFSTRFLNTININTTNVKVDSVETFINKDPRTMRCHFAVDMGNQDLDKEEGVKRVTSVLQNFNSPFRPFVLASTSIGQEGLDFHFYCRKLIHWNLPSNPIDIEQREGRINRFKGLVIRQNVAKKYGKYLVGTVGDIWEELFKVARRTEGETGIHKPDLVPYWHVEGDEIFIDRIIPVLPYSREIGRLKHMLAVLTLYRLTFGQPRQEELIETLYKNLDPDKLEMIREKFMIDLSPINYLGED